MKKLKKLMSVLLATCLLVAAIPVTANAANACRNIGGSSSNYSWTNIDVETGKNWGSNKITFTQNKGNIDYYGIGTSTYGAYTIVVKEYKNGKVASEKTLYWKYKENYTIKLKDRTKYVISVRPYKTSTVGDQRGGCNLSARIHKIAGTYSNTVWGWRTAPTWSASSTKAVSSCDAVV